MLPPRGRRHCAALTYQPMGKGGSEPELELEPSYLWSLGAVCTFPKGTHLPRLMLTNPGCALCRSSERELREEGGIREPRKVLVDSLVPLPGLVSGFPPASPAGERLADLFLLLCWHLHIWPKRPTPSLGYCSPDVPVSCVPSQPLARRQ